MVELLRGCETDNVSALNEAAEDNLLRELGLRRISWVGDQAARTIANDEAYGVLACRLVAADRFHDDWRERGGA